MSKKVTSIIISLILVLLVALSACKKGIGGDNEGNKPDEGNAKTGFISVGDHDISEADFISYAKMELLSNTEDLDKEINGIPYHEQLKEKVAQDIIYNYIASVFAKDNNISLTDTDKAEVEAAVNEKDESWLSSVELTKDKYRTILEARALREKVNEYLFGQGGPNELQDSDYNVYFETNYIHYSTIRFNKFINGTPVPEENWNQSVSDAGKIMAELSSVKTEELGSKFAELKEQYDEDYKQNPVTSYYDRLDMLSASESDEKRLISMLQLQQFLQVESDNEVLIVIRMLNDSNDISKFKEEMKPFMYVDAEKGPYAEKATALGVSYSEGYKALNLKTLI